MEIGQALTTQGISTLKNTLPQGKVRPIVQVKTLNLQKQGNYSYYKLGIGNLTQTENCILAPENNYLFDQGKVGVLGLIKVVQWSHLHIHGKKILRLDLVEILKTRKTSIQQFSYKFSSIPQCKESNKLIIREQQDIRSLNISTTEWILRAKVIKKSTIRTWNNSQSSGKLFRVTLFDRNQDEIIGTFFNQAVNLFYPVLEVDRIYTFSKGALKNSNPHFNPTENTYEIIFDSNSKIEYTPGNCDIGQVPIQIVKLVEIPNYHVGDRIDICVIVVQVSQTVQIVSKSGRALKKKVLTVLDESEHSIELTLWNNEAQLIWKSQDIIVAKHASVSNFNGISLSLNQSSTLLQSNNYQQANYLKNWYRMRKTFPINSLSVKQASPRCELIILNKLKNEWKTKRRGQSYVKIIGAIQFIQTQDLFSMIYPACWNQSCKKKVSKNSFGQYYCQNCKLSSVTCLYRYMVTVKIADCSDCI